MDTDIDRLQSAAARVKPTEEIAMDTDDEPTKKRRGLREGFVILLPMAIAGALVAGVLMFDQLGPTTDRRATVTSTYTERSGRRGQNTDHIAAGVDEDGGTFELTLQREDWQQVADGQEIVVSRAVLTGRVVDVHETGGWGIHTTARVVGLSVGLGIALVAAVGSVVGLRLLRVPQTARTRRRERVWLIAAALAAVVGVGIYIAVERSAAHAAGGEPVDLRVTSIVR